MGLNAGATMCLWRTQSLPSTMTKPLPNIGSLSFLNTLGLPHFLAITTFDIFFKNSGSAMYKNGSVPNQYTNTLPTPTKKSILNKTSINIMTIWVVTYAWHGRLTMWFLPAREVRENERVYIVWEIWGNNWRLNDTLSFHLFNVPKWKTWGWPSQPTFLKQVKFLVRENPPRKS